MSDPDDDDRDRDLVRRAIEALDAIGMTFDHWLVIGEAFERGRQSAMREARTNVPKGRGYNDAYSRWMKRYEAGRLSTIDQAARFRLAKIIEHRSEVLAWRETLTSNQRREWSHPSTVWRRFEASHKVPDDGEKKPSQVAQLKESLAKALDENARLEERLKRDSGSLFDIGKDSAEEIAEILVRKLNYSAKAEDIARRIRRKMREKQKPAG